MQTQLQVRTSNAKARGFVETKTPFKGANTFGEWVNAKVFAVYSYGYHWPLYACIDGCWFENIDKYSQTTSKHKSQLRPASDFFTGCRTQTLKDLIGGSNEK